MTLAEQLQTINGLHTTVSVAGAYGVGCLTTGYYLVRAQTGRDIRELASGNVGARNVGRALGPAGFLLTLLGDFGKGALAVWATEHFTSNGLLTLFALLAVTVGHIWPVQLLFRGGKGVATSLGGLLLWDWHLALAYAAIFAGLLLVVRRVTLPGLFAYLGLPFVSFWLRHDPVETFFMATLCALVLFAHRKNILEEMPFLAARRGVTPETQKPKL